MILSLNPMVILLRDSFQAEGKNDSIGECPRHGHGPAFATSRPERSRRSKSNCNGRRREEKRPPLSPHPRINYHHVHSPARKIPRSIINNQSRVQNIVRRHRMRNIHNLHFRIDPEYDPLHRPHQVVIRTVIGSQSNYLTRQVALPGIKSSNPMQSILIRRYRTPINLSTIPPTRCSPGAPPHTAPTFAISVVLPPTHLYNN